jgi:hypothetical protein
VKEARHKNKSNSYRKRQGSYCKTAGLLLPLVRGANREGRWPIRPVHRRSGDQEIRAWCKIEGGAREEQDGGLAFGGEEQGRPVFAVNAGEACCRLGFSRRRREASRRRAARWRRGAARAHAGARGLAHLYRARARAAEAATAMAASADGPLRAWPSGPARARADWAEPGAQPNPVDRFFSFFSNFIFNA